MGIEVITGQDNNQRQYKNFMVVHLDHTLVYRTLMLSMHEKGIQCLMITKPLTLPLPRK